MMRALYSAVSGLASQMLRLDVVGNNIANANTTGFKAGRVDFAEAFAQTVRAATTAGDRVGGTNPVQIGTGARVGGVSQLYTQGSLQTTGVATDLGIEGNGLFVLSDGVQPLYTRDGAFRLDARGRLVSASGALVVQGYGIDRVSGTRGSSLQDVVIPLAGGDPAQASTRVTLTGNLDADSLPLGSQWQSATLRTSSGTASTTTALVDLRAALGDSAALLTAGDKLQLTGTLAGSEFTRELAVSASTRVADLLTALETAIANAGGASAADVELDSQGRIVVRTPDEQGTLGELSALSLSAVDATGQSRAAFSTACALSELRAARDASSFSTEATVYDTLGFAHRLGLTLTRVAGTNEFSWTAQVDDGAVAITAGATGRIRFGADGSTGSVRFDSAGGATPTALTIRTGAGGSAALNVGLAVGSAGTFDGLTMLRGETTLSGTGDGHAYGAFTDFAFDEAGRIQARYSNGVVRPVAQLALAEFVNPAGLLRVGDNAYIASPNSGTPVLGVSGETVQSTLAAGTLEQSNVDLAREFTEMIIAQRGFQANARVITSSDEMLAELVNLRS